MSVSVCVCQGSRVDTLYKCVRVFRVCLCVCVLECVCVCVSVSVCVCRGSILYTIVLECVRERECVC